MSKKCKPNGGHRKIPPYLFENGEKVVVVGCPDILWTVVGRKHCNTSPIGNSAKPFNRYHIKYHGKSAGYSSRFDDFVEERKLTRAVSVELVRRAAARRGSRHA